MNDYQLLFLSVCLATFYGVVFLAIIVDLVSGVRKAKIRGDYSGSKGYRRTVDKAVRYYNLLFALTIADVPLMLSFHYLSCFYAVNWLPVFPFFTFGGALGICGIEIKSVFEKADKKTKGDVIELARVVAKLAEAHGDLTKYPELFQQYLSEEEAKGKYK